MSLLTDIPNVLREFGVSVEQAIAGLPIDAEVFSDPDRRIPYSLCGELLCRCARITNCPHFGLILGSRHDHRALGAPGLWMQHAPDLEVALTGFCRLQSGNSRGAAAYLHRYGGDAVLFGYGIYDRSAVGHDVIYGVIEALVFNLVKALTDGVARPIEVLFSFRRPLDVKPYSSVFNVPFRFDQPATGLVLPLSALAAAIPGARGDEREHLMLQAGAEAPRSDRVWTDRVRHSIRPMLLRGDVTIAGAAAHLGLSVRTLSRRLEAEGASFHLILNDIRYAAARELLTITDLPIGDIAGALSYGDHSSFDEAFRRWSGVSPSEWRKAIHRGRDAVD